MLEGKELEGKIGEFGGYSVDLGKDGKLTVSVEAKVDLIAELKKLAAQTATPMDDAAIAWVEKMLAVL
jgi:hypothetical protein